MIHRRVIRLLLPTLALLASGSAHAQVQKPALEILPPDQPEAAGSVTVRWRDMYDRGDVIITGKQTPPSVTWYYSKSAQGTDRTRIRTLMADTFGQGMLNWDPVGLVGNDWLVSRERSVNFIRGQKRAVPLVLPREWKADLVITARVRARTPERDFGVGLRYQENHVSYVLRGTGELCKLPNSVLKPCGDARKDLLPNQWYWYELAVRTVNKTEVDLRAQVLDDSRQKVLAYHAWRERPSKDLLSGGVVAIFGAADFAEVYVDPWAARWLDDRANEFQWDTRDVPEGEYFILGEVVDADGKLSTAVSKFKVKVAQRDAEKS